MFQVTLTHVLKDTMATIEDTDEMPHYYAAFLQGLHYLLRLKGSSEKDIQF